MGASPSSEAFHFATPKVRGGCFDFPKRTCPKKTVKISAFCKVTTSCQQGTCIIGNYLQLTIVRLRRSDWQFFRSLAFSLFSRMVSLIPDHQNVDQLGPLSARFTGCEAVSSLIP
jgi:hypothetical protein